jgi:hypothetical protein
MKIVHDCKSTPPAYIFVGPNYNKKYLTSLIKYYKSILGESTVIVAPSEVLKRLERVELNAITDEALLSGYDFSNAIDKLQYITFKYHKIKRSKNWYNQQILKILAVLHNEKALIIDGDTFVSKRCIDLAAKGFLFTTKERAHYYLYTKILEGTSFISNFGLAYSDPIKNEFNETNPFKLINLIFEACVDQILDFSEYQLFAYLAMKHHNSNGIAPLRFFRRFDLLSDTLLYENIASFYFNNQLVYKYDAIAFEGSHNKNKSRQFQAFIAYYLNYTW